MITPNCPYCDSEPASIHYAPAKNHCFVACHCGAKGPTDVDPARAKSKWAQRARETALAKHIEALEKDNQEARHAAAQYAGIVSEFLESIPLQDVLGASYSPADMIAYFRSLVAQERRMREKEKSET